MYCERSDIYPKRIATQTVIDLTDDTRSKTAMDAALEEVVDQVIVDASAEVNGYCQKRYAIPLTPVPALIRVYCVDLAIYLLYVRRDMEIPETRKERRKQAIAFFEMLARGDITLGEATPAAVSTASQVDITSSTPQFRREDLEDC